MWLLASCWLLSAWKRRYDSGQRAWKGHQKLSVTTADKCLFLPQIPGVALLLLPLVETVIPMHTARTQTASHAGVPDGCHVFVMKTEKENVYPSGCVEETQQKPRKTSD